MVYQVGLTVLVNSIFAAIAIIFSPAVRISVYFHVFYKRKRVAQIYARFR